MGREPFRCCDSLLACNRVLPAEEPVRLRAAAYPTSRSPALQPLWPLLVPPLLSGPLSLQAGLGPPCHPGAPVPPCCPGSPPRPSLLFRGPHPSKLACGPHSPMPSRGPHPSLASPAGPLPMPSRGPPSPRLLRAVFEPRPLQRELCGEASGL